MSITEIHRRHGFAPPPRKSAPEPEGPFASLEAAAEALVAAESVDAELANLDDTDAKAQAAVDRAIEKRNETLKASEDRRRELRAARDQAKQARQFILSTSTPSAEERELHERAIALQSQIPEVSHRFNYHSPTRPDPETLERKLEEKQSLLRQARDASNGRGATSSHLASKLETEVHNLTVVLARERKKFEGWSQVQDLKQQAADCAAGRDRLREEREQVALGEALARVKA